MILPRMFKGKPKPLFVNESGDGEVIFQTGDKLYLYYLDNKENVFCIKDYTDLESLVSAINDSGFGELNIVNPRYC